MTGNSYNEVTLRTFNKQEKRVKTVDFGTLPVSTVPKSTIISIKIFYII